MYKFNFHAINFDLVVFFYLVELNIALTRHNLIVKGREENLTAGCGNA